MAEITNWVKKIWKNRTTEFPTRRTLMKEDGSSEIVTVTRNEGTVSEEGDAFDADTMNNLEERIDAGFAEVNGKLIQEIGNANGSINGTMNVNLDNYKILFVIISASAQSVIMCSNYDDTSYYGAGSSFTASGIQDCRITLVKTDANKWRIDGVGFYSVARIYGFK